ENKIVKELFLQNVFAIGNQPFIFFSEKYCVCLSGNSPAAATHIIRNAYTDGGRQNSKHPLTSRIAEDFFEHLVTMIARSQPIAMTNKEFLSVKFKSLWFKINGYVQLFLKITFHPHIVVANKKMHGNTAIGDGSHFPQDTHVSFGN